MNKVLEVSDSQLRGGLLYMRSPPPRSPTVVASCKIPVLLRGHVEKPAQLHRCVVAIGCNRGDVKRCIASESGVTPVDAVEPSRQHRRHSQYKLPGTVSIKDAQSQGRHSRAVFMCPLFPLSNARRHVVWLSIVSAGVVCQTYDSACSASKSRE